MVVRFRQNVGEGKGQGASQGRWTFKAQNVPSNDHVARLADAVDAVDRLLLHRRIPPGGETGSKAG